MRWKVETFGRLRPARPGHPRSDMEIHQAVGPGGVEEATVLDLLIPETADDGSPVHTSQGHVQFTFTDVFDETVQQDEVYRRVAEDLVVGALQGYNACVFAYGQTGSGKTYTISGGDDFSERGIVPRAISTVFSSAKRQSDTKYRVFVSYMQIYNEHVYDLLDRENRGRPVEEWPQVHMLNDDEGLMHMQNLNVFEAATEEECLSLLFMGNINRITSSTPMNHASSRSHAIFTLHIEGESLHKGKTTFTTGKINLVDLAGSERPYRKENSETTRTEGRHINLSLHYLEQVVVFLNAKAKQAHRARRSSTGGGGRRSSSSGGGGGGGMTHIPYRNSVMTSILRDTLGGNTRTSFIMTLNPEMDNVDETVSSCRFAQRCSQLSVQVSANEAVDLKDQVLELEETKQLLTKQLQGAMGELEQLRSEVINLERYRSETEARELREVDTEEAQFIRQTAQGFLANAEQAVAAVSAMDRVALLQTCFVLRDQYVVASDSLMLARADTQRTAERLDETEQQRSALQEELDTMIDQHEELKSVHAAHQTRMQQRLKREDPRDCPAQFVDRHWRLLTKGQLFIKHGRHGKPHVRFIWLSDDLCMLRWRSPGEDDTRNEIRMDTFSRVVRATGAAPARRPKRHSVFGGAGGQQAAGGAANTVSLSSATDLRGSLDRVDEVDDEEQHEDEAGSVVSATGSTAPLGSSSSSSGSTAGAAASTSGGGAATAANLNMTLVGEDGNRDLHLELETSGISDPTTQLRTLHRWAEGFLYAILVSKGQAPAINNSGVATSVAAPTTGARVPMRGRHSISTNTVRTSTSLLDDPSGGGIGSSGARMSPV